MRKNHENRGNVGHIDHSCQIKGRLFPNAGLPNVADISTVLTEDPVQSHLEFCVLARQFFEFLKDLKNELIETTLTMTVLQSDNYFRM